MLKRLWIFTVFFSLALTACTKSESERQDTASTAENTAVNYLDDSGEWIAEKLEEAEIPAPMPNEVYAIVTAQDESSVTVKLANLGEEEFAYGHSFRVDVFLDKWYTVPPTTENETETEFIAEALLLQSRQTNEKTYDFSAYDPFPAGRYRVVTDTFWFEFTAGKTISPQNTLLDKAVNISSFGYFDGQSVTLGHLYFKDSEISQFLSIFSENPAVFVGGMSSSFVKAPVIGIKYQNMYGYTNECAWTNGYFIDTTGGVYRLDIDERVLKNMLFSAENKTVIEEGYISQLPCKGHLCRDNGWIEEFLEPVSFEPPAAPENITAEITEIDGFHLTVKYTNNGEKDWTYGEYFRIDVKLNDNWYYIPEIPGTWVFLTYAAILPAGESAEMDYSFDRFFGLPIGDYRITANDFCLEFVSTDEGDYGYLM